MINLFCLHKNFIKLEYYYIFFLNVNKLLMFFLFSYLCFFIFLYTIKTRRKKIKNNFLQNTIPVLLSMKWPLNSMVNKEIENNITKFVKFEINYICIIN